MTRRNNAQHGAAAIIAMMFLVIFSSLAAAMAIVAQGNLSTADSHLKMNRALATAETGMRFVIYRINQVVAAVQTRDGLIDQTNAPALWDETRDALLVLFQADSHNIQAPYVTGTQLSLGPIAAGPGAPTFTATLTPHPLAGENYGGAYYQRSPYSEITPAVSAIAPLDNTWIRVRVVASDGATGDTISRSIQMDFKIDKKIRFAILSKSRVMIGRNVMIQGQIGSRFMDTNLENGHPIQMRSDFYGLDGTLDTQLDALIGTLILNDANGDNRINLSNPAEIDGMTDPEDLDTNADGYIDEYDFFLAHFDTNADGNISSLELDTDNNVSAAQLLSMIDTFGDPTRYGYNDGQITDDDRYMKIRGQVLIAANMDAWNSGAAGGAYQDFFKGPLDANYGEAPLTFDSTQANANAFEPSDFDVSSFQAMATGDMLAQATAQAANNDPDDSTTPQPLGNTAFEEVPYGSAYPYDYYDRPVYENMTFTDVTIPQGSNALFINCTFVGATYVQTSVNNDDPNFNFSGMQESDGSQKYEGLTSSVNGAAVTDTKTVANNVRFHGCTFEGSVISSAPPSYTQVRNKIAFTGTTRFNIDNSANLSDAQKAIFKRSTLLAPHYSVEMGSFVDAVASSETVKLTGTIVAGVLDMRGQVDITGTLLTTFEPINGQGPVSGDTSPQFNTTLGYFESAAGDMEAELPAQGVGIIKVRYDPTIAMPDGILGPIEIEPALGTYTEGG